MHDRIRDTKALHYRLKDAPSRHQAVGYRGLPCRGDCSVSNRAGQGVQGFRVSALIEGPASGLRPAATARATIANLGNLQLGIQQCARVLRKPHPAIPAIPDAHFLAGIPIGQTGLAQHRVLVEDRFIGSRIDDLDPLCVSIPARPPSRRRSMPGRWALPSCELTARVRLPRGAAPRQQVLQCLSISPPELPSASA
jgi:hypothetical protein